MKKEIKKIGKKYSPEVMAIISSAIESIEVDGDVEKKFVAMLDLLAINYQIYFDAYREIHDNGLFITNDRGNLQKSPAVDVMSKAFAQIAAISKCYGLTPLDVKKIEAYDRKQDEAEEKSPLAEWFAKESC